MTAYYFISYTLHLHLKRFYISHYLDGAISTYFGTLLSNQSDKIGTHCADFKNIFWQLFYATYHVWYPISLLSENGKEEEKNTSPRTGPAISCSRLKIWSLVCVVLTYPL